MNKSVKTVKLEFLSTLATLPKKGTSNSAAYDLYATSVEYLGDGRVRYGLGIAFDPGEYKITLKARSSIHTTGLILSNGVGLGDPDYRGEYMAVFYEVIKGLPHYVVGDRICQMEIEESIPFTFSIVASGGLSETERGAGGFGSTGLK